MVSEEVEDLCFPTKMDLLVSISTFRIDPSIPPAINRESTVAKLNKGPDSSGCENKSLSAAVSWSRTLPSQLVEASLEESKYWRAVIPSEGGLLRDRTWGRTRESAMVVSLGIVGLRSHP